MMKKVLILLCLLALVTGILAVSASAAPTDYTCQCCGKAYKDVPWQPWTLTDGGTNNTLTENGHYYLTGDVTTIKSQVRIGDDTLKSSITIDLRGFTMASTKRVFGVYAGSTLSIVDSVGGGKITGAQTGSAQVGGVIRINSGATLNLYGGTVADAATTDHAAFGAAISTEGNNCIINIAGGNVTGSAFTPKGGAIYASRNAIVNISAGTVTGGTANAGGAIYLDKATLNITGGTVMGGELIRENAADEASAGCGGAIYAGSGSQVTVDGGEIIGGKAYNGSAIALMSSNLDVISGSIQGSAVSNYGSAIHLLADAINETAIACNVNITGGQISALQTSGKTAITMASNAHILNMSDGIVTGAGKAGAGGSAIAGQGTAATINITGGTITGAASSTTSRSGVVYSRGFLNISGGDISVTAGNGPAVYMYQDYGKLTISGSATETLPGKVRLVDDAKVAGGSGALSVVDGITDGLWYQRGIDAVNNLPEGGFVRSFGGGILNLQGKKGVPVDVNGQTMKIRNGTFYGFDSANNSFNPDKCGNMTLDGGVLLANSYTAPTGNSYVAVTAEDGKLSFHRCEMVLTGVTLRTSIGKEGIYYSATVRADAQAISVLDKYGIALSLRQSPEDWTAAMDDTVKRSTYPASGLKASKVNTINSTSLVNVINISNSTLQNNDNGATVIFARPYIQLADGSFIYGQQADTTMRQVAAQADGLWDTLNDTQKKGLLGMYERFASTLNGWSMPNLQAAYTSGDPSVNALVLQYRRERVIAAMRAQLQVLWTVDRQVVYSKSAESKGPEADLANYIANQQAAGKTPDPLSDQIITLYPDRIYQGLPYTHASSSLDALALFSEQDSNGIFHVQNASTSLFSGGSTDGKKVDSATGERTGQFNVARIGNDCWDMVHFAWGEIVGDITAPATRDLTPSFGLQWIGEDILTNAMIANKYVAPDGYDMTASGSTLIDCICVKNSKGLYVFKSIGQFDDQGNEVPNYDVDGTRLVRYGTRTQNANGTYDYQAMYKTYAMLQPGDGVVTWKNSSGHAMMVVKVDVVYNSDGTIDGSKSIMTLLEQGSGHEERQSRLVSEFDSAVSAKHGSHASANKSCLYCAGYTDQVIDGKHVWKLDYCDDQTRTFQQMAESDHLAFTCDALRTVELPATGRISLTNTGHGIMGMFTGRVYASYRVTSVTLEITDEKGKTISTDCIGLQSTVGNFTYVGRFFTDQTAGIGETSVLTDTMPLVKHEDGSITANLNPGRYTYRFTCTLNSGHKLVLRDSYFYVEAGGVIKEAPKPGSGPTVVLPTEPPEEE